MVFYFKNNFFLYLALTLFQASCKDYETQNTKISKWIIQNEVSLYKQLNETLKDEINKIRTTPTLISESYAFSKYDSTILGNLASKVNEIDTCYVTTYKIYHMNSKIDLTIAKPWDSKCDAKIKFIRDTLNLKHFRLIFN